MYKINSINKINLINYDKIIKSDIVTDYGYYKSGNESYINILSKKYFDYIIDNIDIDILDNEWIIIIPSVYVKKTKKLILLLGEQLKILLDKYFNYDFKIFNIYLEYSTDNYNYSNLNNFNDRYKLANNNIYFEQNINLYNKKIILIDDSYIYGVTIKINLHELEKYNLNINNLYIIVYIKPENDVLEKYNNFEYILNNSWFNNVYKKDFDKLYFCKLIINSFNQYILTPKSLIYFLTLNNNEIIEIIKLIGNNKLFFKKIIENIEIYELDNIYFDNYILFKEQCV